MCDLYVVTIDTRGKSSSDIKGYHEHACSEAYFRKHIAGHPDAVCFKSKVAALCGINLKVYFTRQDKSVLMSENDISSRSEINRAATLLTLDPETGFAEHHVRGVAYVVQDDGLAPLSLNQVWGIQELINYATDVYKSDPEHRKRGKRELKKSCKMYRYQSWGPLSIYKPRPELANTVVPPSVIKVKPSSRKPFSTIQT
mmetsp:Transcript_118815/g.177595  ORF Transcript_118815/g.177595 Transcript_118815/m.177595 type:complete len:199 (-) Transcript_118815:82-678(-)|eukprot:CAMPEP_0117013266 /NCGR_PEP_ID=MMETSP0472-20121206/10983_1 /TAXON_ID=693140 ORGANISM="Tiarina fusus, Strain LIS" /NCGR_SAMPLE_ID=MMETSP0472 /ASSEMBLY_ACC=CAM_ASM_000603 /LENGTH=198 /DNA_ID=CAMNT_0004716537 /DNA_START=68 /DNA_END=664 /DNA_ORIENTATION=+